MLLRVLPGASVGQGMCNALCRTTVQQLLGSPRVRSLQGHSAVRKHHLLVGFGGRDTSHSQEDKDLSPFGGFQPWHCLRSSPRHAVLACPKAAPPISLQPVDTQPASPPRSHCRISSPLLMSLCPCWLLLGTQSQGLITESLWVSWCTTAPPYE